MVSRRRFFKIAGLALGGSALACCGLGYAVWQAAPKTQTDEVDNPSFNFVKDASMEKSILVAYATRTGSTVDVAAAIGKTLAERGYTVDVKPFSENPNPDGYDAVILGSAVNGGHWLPEAVEFVRGHQQALGKMPLALFCVHIMNLGDDTGSQKKRLAYLNEVRSVAAPVSEGYFAGKGVDPQNTAPLLRWVLRTLNLMPEGDCRDWTKISAWAQTVFA